MNRIVEQLAQLSEHYAYRDLLALDKAHLIEEATPPEVREAVAKIEMEYSLQEAATTDTIAVLTSDIKAAIIVAGASVKGEHWQALCELAAAIGAEMAEITMTPEVTRQLLRAAKLAYPIVAGARLAAAYGRNCKPQNMTHETWKLQSAWAYSALRNALTAAGVEVED